MICPPCERQLDKAGRHRAHKGCELNVVQGSAAGPCWCPVCHPIPKQIAVEWFAAPTLDLTRNDGVPDTRMMAEIAAVLRVDRGALISWVGSQEIRP